MLVNMCPPTMKRIITIIVDSILLLVNGCITYIAVIYYKKPTPVLNISRAYIRPSILVSLALMSVYSVVFLIRDCKAPKELQAEV